MWIKRKTIASNVALILLPWTLTVNSNLDFFFSSKACTICNAIINHSYMFPWHEILLYFYCFLYIGYVLWIISFFNVHYDALLYKNCGNKMTMNIIWTVRRATDIFFKGYGCDFLRLISENARLYWHCYR